MRESVSHAWYIRLSVVILEPFGESGWTNNSIRESPLRPCEGSSRQSQITYAVG